MQHLDLKITVSNTTLELIDAVRVNRPREDVVRQMIELGLSEIVETAARAQRESAISSFYDTTQGLKLARNNILSVRLRGLNVSEAEDDNNPNSRRYETIQSITGRAARG